MSGNLQGQSGESPTALFSARSVQDGNLENLKRLLETQDINQTDINGNSLLILSLEYGKNSNEISKYLIESGIDVNIQNKFDFSAIIYACLRGKPEIIEMLVDCGADVNVYDGMHCGSYASDENGYSPISAVVDSSNLSTEERIKAIDILHDAGASLDHQSSSMATALMYAARQGKVKIVEKLIDIGASLDLVEVDKFSAAHFPAGSHTEDGSAEAILTLLANAGADMDKSDDNDETPAEKALINDFPERLRIILESGIDIATLYQRTIVEKGYELDSGYTHKPPLEERKACLGLIRFHYIKHKEDNGINLDDNEVTDCIQILEEGNESGILNKELSTLKNKSINISNEQNISPVQQSRRF